MTGTPPNNRSEELTDRYRSLSTPHTSSTWKVLGEIDAPTGTGVLGHNTATSGQSFGVKGVTDSADDATGVLGKAPAGEADGVIGIANNGGIGVGALTDSPSQVGMLALNAFRGAVLAPSGRVVFVPLESANVGVLDTNAQTIKARVTALHPLINTS